VIRLLCQAKSDYPAAGLWVQLSGVKSGSGSSKGVEVETVPIVDPLFGGLAAQPFLTEARTASTTASGPGL